MREIVVELGGQAYTVKQRPIREAKAWRQRLAGPFQELASTLEGAGNLDLTAGKDIAQLVKVLSGSLIGSIDLVLELLFEYAPTLAEDQERIEAEAYDDEALEAFVEVLKLVYPLGRLQALARGL